MAAVLTTTFIGIGGRVNDPSLALWWFAAAASTPPVAVLCWDEVVEFSRRIRWFVTAAVAVVCITGYALVARYAVTKFAADLWNHMALDSRESQQFAFYAKQLAARQEHRAVGIEATATAGRSHKANAEPNHLSPSVGPRLGIGPEAYRDISDEKLGQWAINEAQKIGDMAEEAMRASKETARAKAWFFTLDFQKCCEQSVKDLREEILRRLGPDGKDAREIEMFESLFPTQGREMMTRISPLLVAHYAPYLRGLGVKLRTSVVPRKKPVDLPFSIERVPPKQPGGQGIVITIKTPRDVNSGYIAVEFTGPVGEAASDFGDSRSSWTEGIQNPDLARLFSKNDAGIVVFVMRVGAVPFAPEKPIHVIAYGFKATPPPQVVAVKCFDL